MKNANVKDYLLQLREEEYREYLEDIGIALDELSKMKLYPVEGRIICDLYAIPSQNFQTYYAVVYEKDGRYNMVYAKPQFYEPITYEWIKMYRFKDAKEVEGHPVKDGRIIVGIKPLSAGFVDKLFDMANNFPTSVYNEVGLLLDGCFQAIRVYKDNIVSGEVCFTRVSEVAFPEGKGYLANMLENLYIEVGELIE